jgi:SnoaL-like domain
MGMKLFVWSIGLIRFANALTWRFSQGDAAMMPAVVRDWHEVVRNRDHAALDRLLADDVVFHSPVVHTPQAGKAVTRLYLQAATEVLGGAGFHYVREVWSDTDAVLEFVNEIDGITINGVDLIRWNSDNRIVDFKVMVRPLKAVNLLHQKMGEMLQRIAKPSKT